MVFKTQNNDSGSKLRNRFIPHFLGCGHGNFFLKIVNDKLSFDPFPLITQIVFYFLKRR
jgi:hypothetical protein